MPRSVDEGFRDFLSSLTPSSAESAAATSHRESIRRLLDSEFGLRRYLRIGSFGNGTSISGFSDVDYLACLNHDVFTRNSANTLKKVREALEFRFPNTGVHVDSPAVAVPFGRSASETTEVVPANEIGTQDEGPVYEIADGDGGWMKVSPDAHKAYVRRVDEKFGGMVKPLIRFVKAWKFLRTAPISSFYLELRVARYAAGEQSIIYSIDVERILRQLLDGGLAAMQDPSGVSGYIYPCRSQAELDDALSKLSTAATRAGKAEDERKAGNVADAFYWWRLLYGDWFPSYYY